MKPSKNIRNTDKFSSLAAQIKATERQIMDRQQGVDVRTNRLIKDLHQQMTKPATLLLAVGVGFIVGELTQPPPKKERCTTQSETAPATPPVTDSHPLKSAINFMSLAHTLYQLLPLTLIMNTFYPVELSKTELSANAKENQNPSV
jgi:hypothetical protein